MRIKEIEGENLTIKKQNNLKIKQKINKNNEIKIQTVKERIFFEIKTTIFVIGLFRH